ncbi:hypothetical protein BS78_09G062700 [Paspalum vaginatum]|nr:hypothetical protein BS78_09G062700 [Paspalum vaginatum]
MARYDDRYDYDDQYDHYDRHGNNTKLYVGQISSQTRTEDLEKLFSKYGRLRNVDLKRDFGFVEFIDHRDAEDAMYDLDGRKFDGSRIIVEFARGVRRGPGGVRQYDRGPPPGRCYNCGMDGHWVRDCKAGDWRDRCYRCGEMGHKEMNCKNSPKDLKRGRSYSRSPSPHHKKRQGRSYSRSPPSRHEKRQGRSNSRSPPPRHEKRQGRSNSRSPPRHEKRQGRSNSKSPPPHHEKHQGRSSSRSPSPRHGRGYGRSPHMSYSRPPSPKRDSRNAGGEELPSRSPRPRRSSPPREQATRNGSYHGETQGKGQ